MTTEDEIHSSFQNVVSKFTSHTVQKHENQKEKKKKFILPRWKSKIKVIYLGCDTV